MFNCYFIWNMCTKINLLIITMSEEQINLTSKEMTFCANQLDYNIKWLFPSLLLYSCQLGNMLEEESNMTRQNVVPSKKQVSFIIFVVISIQMCHIIHTYKKDQESTACHTCLHFVMFTNHFKMFIFCQ